MKTIQFSIALLIFMITAMFSNAMAQKYLFQSHELFEEYNSVHEPLGGYSKTTESKQSYTIDFDEKKIINNKDKTEIIISDIEKTVVGKETEYNFKAIISELPFYVTFSVSEKNQNAHDTLSFEYMEISEEFGMPKLSLTSTYKGKSEKQ